MAAAEKLFAVFKFRLRRRKSLKLYALGMLRASDEEKYQLAQEIWEIGPHRLVVVPLQDLQEHLKVELELLLATAIPNLMARRQFLDQELERKSEFLALTIRLKAIDD